MYYHSLPHIQLDIAQNRLLRPDVSFGMIAMCISFRVHFSGIMGMNLEDGWDFTNWSVLLTVLIIVSFS